MKELRLVKTTINAITGNCRVEQRSHRDGTVSSQIQRVGQRRHFRGSEKSGATPTQAPSDWESV